MRVIGVDPSLSATGLVAVDLDTMSVVDSLVISVEPDKMAQTKTADMARRLHEMSVLFRQFLARNAPALVAIEGQVGASMGKAGMGSVGKLMAAYGSIVGACPSRPIVILPVEVKRRLTGQKGASKEEAIAAALKQMSGIHSLKGNAREREALSDALCVVVASLPEIRQVQALVGQPKVNP